MQVLAVALLQDHPPVQQNCPPPVSPVAAAMRGLIQPNCINLQPYTKTQTMRSVKSGVKRRVDVSKRKSRIHRCTRPRVTSLSILRILDLFFFFFSNLSTAVKHCCEKSPNPAVQLSSSITKLHQASRGRWGTSTN